MIKSTLYVLLLVIGVILAYNACYSQLFVVVLLFLVLKQGSKEHFFFNPFYIIAATLISYLCYYPQLGGAFFSELLFKTQCLICFCLLAVFVGFLVVRDFKVKPITVGDYSENFFFAFVVGVFPTLVSVYLFGNTLDMSGEDLLEAKENMTLPFLGQLMYWLPASIIIACKKNKTKWIILSLVVSVVTALMSVTKTGMLIALLFFAIGASVFSPSILQHKIALKIKKYAIIWIPIALICFFSYNNKIRHDADTDRDMAFVENSNSQYWSTSDAGQGLFLNYLYLCSPWSNLNYNVERQRELGFGVNTFAQFAHLLRLPEKRIEKLNPTFLNTHTFITDYYIDFGFYGAIIASFVLGMFIYFCYRKFGCSDDPLLLSFYVLITYATFMMFFSNHFNNGYLLNYFITFVGYSSIFRKRKKCR